MVLHGESVERNEHCITGEKVVETSRKFNIHCAFGHYLNVGIAERKDPATLFSKDIYFFSDICSKTKKTAITELLRNLKFFQK